MTEIVEGAHDLAVGRRQHVQVVDRKARGSPSHTGRSNGDDVDEANQEQEVRFRCSFDLADLIVHDLSGGRIRVDVDEIRQAIRNDAQLSEFGTA